MILGTYGRTFFDRIHRGFGHRPRIQALHGSRVGSHNASEQHRVFGQRRYACDCFLPRPTRRFRCGEWMKPTVSGEPSRGAKGAVPAVGRCTNPASDG
jgi:hypothetical protein